jgi:hypothetical protein
LTEEERLKEEKALSRGNAARREGCEETRPSCEQKWLQDGRSIIRRKILCQEVNNCCYRERESKGNVQKEASAK